MGEAASADKPLRHWAMDPVFWQRLLAAEVHATKGRALYQALGPFSDASERVMSHPLLSAAERERARKADLEALQLALKGGACLWEPSEHPAVLSELPLAPGALFTWGDTSCLNAPTIGVVGTRGASTYGRAVAHKFAEAFARAGATVVSGGALGIDAAAHKGALAGGGPTVAVLASGIDRVYPAMHRGLFQQIRVQGCLVSQFAAGVMPGPYRFLMRNQIIASLSRVLVVIEAPERSGALSTAHAANDLGRDVFVVPANVDNLNFRGSHAQLRDGAPLADHPEVVLDALGLSSVPPQEPVAVTTPEQTRILETLGSEPRSTESIVDRTGLDASVVLAEMTMLELDGRILRVAGGYTKKL